MKVAFSTLGCRVNVYESEAMAEKFIREGYEVVDQSEVADVYVINTCTVTNMGDKKSRQIINKVRRLNENAVVAVVGCYSQMAPQEVSAIPGVDVVLGTRNKGDVVYYVNKAREEGKPQVHVESVLKNKKFEALNIEDYQDKTRAFLKIQDGCNRFCSYCIIPYSRGSVCSKDPKQVIEEVNKLADHGFKEVILSGIHTASYGLDLEEKINLIDIIEEIEKVEGIERIRIGSIEPAFFTEEVIEKIRKFKKLCPHFHLSLQSGCNSTLKRMNRRYTAEEYKETVEMLRRTLPGVSITTDVIVGFPGETEEEFNETYEFLKDIKLAKTHVFKYSPRKGTKAEKMENQIDGITKDKRSKILIELSNKNEDEFIKSFIGQKMDVLIESSVKGKEGYYEGYTTNYIKVHVPCQLEEIIGKIVDVEIKESLGEVAQGQLVIND
ncbi:tRNA (N(6)-L-threonylcarbamoyladenosine(37)-C(2))-methylthiotransferase MtaB [Clostridium isatidis]|uniref:Threonylcarbamoyladenosine tRNA methylthiotransferase MtaB n=1 Tax=Clostridium isatidis TaxID=182773 RepID=A0A343JDR0_9CLOT|nr:tRNA (N(6)-L-threonylcarbamoyladenosine(37)-C(2))-methylthiotransferase MtaB [Clostridium isatidis]ASW43668.1 tRNA (N(6)-L-threonylcarbamoyladenosine(37)-C(2))-methylthiotransferase MtaB [Clostridium isatidis]